MEKNAPMELKKIKKESHVNTVDTFGSCQLSELDYILKKQTERTSESGKELDLLLTFAAMAKVSLRSAPQAYVILECKEKTPQAFRINHFEYARNQFLLPQNLHKLPHARRLSLQILQKTSHAPSRNLPVLPQIFSRLPDLPQLQNRQITSS